MIYVPFRKRYKSNAGNLGKPITLTMREADRPLAILHQLSEWREGAGAILVSK